MVTKRKDTSSAAPGRRKASASPKRPSRTIELEAEEVEIEVTPGADDAEDGDVAAGAGAEGAKSDTIPDDTAAGAEAGDKAETDKPAPPQRTRPTEVKSFVTHLAAGLVGGLIGVVGAGIGLDRLSFTTPAGSGGTADRIAALEQQMRALDDKLGVQEKAAGSAVQPEALAQLETRLAAVEKLPDSAAAVPGDVAERLAKLEGRLKTLRDSAGGEGATGLEQSAALSARIDGISADLDKRVSGLSADIAEVRKTLEARDAPQTGESAGEVAALGQRIATLEQEISALAARPQARPAQSADTNNTALTLAFGSLRRAVEKGEPYAAQLETLRQLAPDGLDLSGLAAHAETGAPAASALLRDLPPLLRTARAAAAKSRGDTFLGRLVSNAQSVVRVRRVGPEQGESAGAVLSRMEAAMKAADLEGVVREAEGLSGAALETLQPWLGKAGARAASDAWLDGLERALLASLKTGAGAQR